MGLGPSKEEFDATKRKLLEAEQRNAALGSETASLQAKLQQQAQALEQQQDALAAAAQAAKDQLEQKDDALGRAVKQRQLAEELRRSDALLAKRLLHSHLRQVPADAANPVNGDAMAASLALAAQDELQLRQACAEPRRTPAELPSRSRRTPRSEHVAEGLCTGGMACVRAAKRCRVCEYGCGLSFSHAQRLMSRSRLSIECAQMLMHTTGELESAMRRTRDMEHAASTHLRGDLARELWLPGLCDVSVTRRSAEWLVLGGVRLPRAPQPGVRGTGLSPGLAVLRQIGAPTAQARACCSKLLAQGCSLKGVPVPLCLYWPCVLPLSTYGDATRTHERASMLQMCMFRVSGQQWAVRCSGMLASVSFRRSDWRCVPNPPAANKWHSVSITPAD